MSLRGCDPKKVLVGAAAVVDSPRRMNGSFCFAEPFLKSRWCVVIGMATGKNEARDVVCSRLPNTAGSSDIEIGNQYPDLPHSLKRHTVDARAVIIKFMAEQTFGTELSNREFFIRRWAHEYPSFVDVFKALPSNQLDYRPHPASRSGGELVALLVSLEQSRVELCLTGRGSHNSSLTLHPTGRLSTLEEMIDAYEHHHRALAEKLSYVDDPTWNRPAWLTRGEQEIILKNTVGGLLWIALFDSVHHRGQLSTYIRPMGGKVPSIYGPSGDAPARQ